MAIGVRDRTPIRATFPVELNEQTSDLGTSFEPTEARKIGAHGAVPGNPSTVVGTSSGQQNSRLRQGQRSLKRCPGKYFQQEVVAPAAAPSFHGDAVLTRMLL
jgi:hypothetical protein